MSTTFPLYNTIISDVRNRDLTEKQKEKLVNKIKSLDQEGKDLIYLLIRFYELDSNESLDSLSLPYGGVISGGELTFDLDKFPNKLKQVLHKFVNAHTIKMKEEKDRAKKKSAI